MAKIMVTAVLFIAILLGSANAPFAQAIDNPDVAARQSEWAQASSVLGEELLLEEADRSPADQHTGFAPPPPAAHGVTVISQGLIGNIAQLLEFNLSVAYSFGGQETSVIQNGNET